MMNICHVISGDLWAGAEVQAYSLIKSLSKSPDVNILVVTFNKGVLSERIAKEGIAIHVLDESQKNILGLGWALFSLLKNSKVDIVHVHGFKEALVSLISRKFLKFKLIRTHHGIGMLDGGLKYRVIEMINASFVDQEIAVSSDLRDCLISFGNKSRKIQVVHNGLFLDEVVPTEPKCETIARLNIDPDDIVIGTLGRLVHVKGYKYFLEGAYEILKDNSNVTFIIAGDGPLFDELKEYAEKLGIYDKIKMLGFRQDVYNIIHACDIFVITSLHEGLPTVLLEAMYLGRPVIATKVGGIPEVINDKFNGILIPPKEPIVFAIACLELIKNHDLRLQLAERAKSDVIANYSAERVMKETKKIYGAVL